MPGSDTGDYTARNLVGIDPRNKLIAIGDVVEPGAELVFCKRDLEAARDGSARIVQRAERPGAASPAARCTFPASRAASTCSAPAAPSSS